MKSFEMACVCKECTSTRVVIVQKYVTNDLKRTFLHCVKCGNEEEIS